MASRAQQGLRGIPEWIRHDSKPSVTQTQPRIHPMLKATTTHNNLTSNRLIKPNRPCVNRIEPTTNHTQNISAVGLDYNIGFCHYYLKKSRLNLPF